MSGLEPLAALSLACNVLQLVEVGHQTITLIKIVYQGKSIDDALDQKAAILGGISDEVKTYKRPAQCPKHEQQLLAAADRCSIAARDLREEIQFLVGNAKKGNLASTLKVVAKTNWRRRRLERLKENLDSTEKLLHTGLLMRIWSGTNTAAIDIKELKGDLRSFIEQYRNGHRNTDELVSRESLEVRKHVSSVSAETINSLGIVRQSLDGMVLDARSQGSQAKRDRLLGSLKFRGFNERRSQVRAAYKDTGKWIFAGDGDETEVVEYPASSMSGGESTESKEFQEETQNLEDDTVDIRWDSFSNWLRSTDVFYWISGKPGSGKTTLVKFIVQHSSTEVLLNIWQPRPLIISHFLWRPGTLLQRSIKGMLCSLLHQLLQNSSRVLDCALSSFPDLKTKDADTDWSVEELHTLCLQVISTYERPLCLFLDGLDEVDIQDGVVQLLSLVHELSQSKNIKICLSSRPEPLLQKRLSGYPRLRLQDLNKRDLKLYARDHVRLPDWNPMDGHGYSPIDSLVDRAEGVFLWIVFAIKSINKGVEYGDTIDLVNTRIHQLPGDLVEMYKDMWKRACADDPLEYRQIAALYFKLMLIHRGNGHSPPNQPSISLELFIFVLASSPIADEILQYGDETPKFISEDRIIQLCRTVERQLDVYCFGLIELEPLPRKESDRIKALGLYGDKYDRVLPSTGGTRYLQFIHRTAYDFLSGTAEGLEILNSDTSSNMSLDIRIIKAQMASSQLFMRVGRFGRPPSLLQAGVPLSRLRTLRLNYQETDDWLVAEWRKLVRNCEDLFDTGRLAIGSSGLFGRTRLCKADDFLKVAANICGNERVSLAIKERVLSKDTRSEILLNACSFPVSVGSDNPLDPCSRDYAVEETIKVLLCDGADPNWKGFLFSPFFWCGPFAQLETPFTRYLTSTILLTSSYNSPYDVLTCLETLCTFIDCATHLDEMVTILFRIGPNYDLKDRKIYHRRLLPCEMSCLSEVDISPNRMGSKNFLIVSFAAHEILDTLLHVMRQKALPPGKELKVSELFSFIQTSCNSWIGSKRSHLICKIAPASGKGGWFETSKDQQERMASDLLRHLRMSLTPVRAALPQLVQVRESLERFLSFYKQGPWDLKSTGTQEACEKLEHLGIFTRVDDDIELRSAGEWAERHRSRYLQGNDDSASRH